MTDQPGLILDGTKMAWYRERVEASLRETQRLEKVLEGRPEVDHLVSFVGTGAQRKSPGRAGALNNAKG